MSFPPSPFPGHVPIAITRLLVAYFCGTTTREEPYQLDEWILQSDSNMEVFEQCLEESLRPAQFDSDRIEEIKLSVT